VSDVPAIPLSFAEQGAALIPGAAGIHCVLASVYETDEIAEAAMWARRLVDADRAPSTVEKYMRDWAQFVSWLGRVFPQQDPCPAHPASVGLYIGALRASNKSKWTILGRIAAIAYVHKVARYPSPMDHDDLEREIRGLRRESAGDDDRQARPAIEREMATEMISALPSLDVNDRSWKALRDLRDRAIFALGWLSAMRRSNIVLLRRRDVRVGRDDLRHRRYLHVWIARSKTDQEGRGRDCILNELPPAEPLCAVRAVSAWLTATDHLPPDAPLFPSFIRNGRGLTDRAISGRDVTLVVKRLAKLAGFRPDALAAHGMRRGFATSAISKGVRRATVKEHVGWKTYVMLDRYTVVDKSRDNAVSDLFE
jgi:site-specific recombinase XerD